MKRSSVLALVFGATLVLGIGGLLWALNASFNRPNPLMDYVPQEIGIYDTGYEELKEYDCRNCHGNSLANRHHLTDPVVLYNVCEPCHEAIEDPPYVTIVRDCLTSGCHSLDDLWVNGWHHNTDIAEAADCVACHDPNLIAEITPFRDFTAYPTSIVTPTPFSCENCHWEQKFSSTADPDAPGHPSTYDHYNAAELFVGFYEYPKPIYGNMATHHMGGPDGGFMGAVSSQCYRCHATDPNEPSWNPYNPNMIRFCETCHSLQSLHGIPPHRYPTNGWEAVGFHVPSGNDNPSDKKPVVYKTWDPTGPYAPETTGGFTTGQMCFGCHGDNVPEPPPVDDCTENMPVIDTSVDGIQPKNGTYGALITLRGHNFGEEQNSLRTVQLKLNDCSSNCWFDLPIISWTDTRIEFKIVPYFDFTPGNYKVRVQTECGNSNRVNFSFENWITVYTISPQQGPCGTSVTLTGLGFGNNQTEISSDGYNGVHRIVDFVSSQGTFTAKKYEEWTVEGIQVKFQNFFEDALDPSTGIRNYVQDDGTGSCPLESTMKKCADLAVGTASVYATAVYFGDDDGSGDLTCGDTIFQVATSDPQYFELTAEPYLNKIYPTKIERNQILKLLGVNFGPDQMDGEVRIGNKAKAEDPALGLGKLLDCPKSWSNTQIKVKVKVPQKWEGKTQYVWVEKGGMKSNYKAIEILEPLVTEEPVPEEP